jgi:adenosine deaminase
MSTALCFNVRVRLIVRLVVATFFAVSLHAADAPPPLREFLYAMPKGGDLHNHLSGAVYAETYLDLARADAMCIDKPNMAIVQCPAIASESIVPAETLLKDAALYSAMLDAMSMRQFRGTDESAHDHFFNTFRKFGAVSRRHVPEMLTNVVERFAEENVAYIETTFAPDLGASTAIIAPLVTGSSIDEMYDSVMSNPDNLRKLDDVVAASRKTVDDAEAAMRISLRCGERFARPGCDSTVRYVYELYRGIAQKNFFAGMLVGYRLASVDPRVVAVNPVMPEDGYWSMVQFDEQMRMFAFFRARYPRVHLTTHAGELTLGLVPIEGLRYHIRDSVLIAGAERIGHGVDIAYEQNANELMKTMAERHIAVEICLTSNDVILGVRGREHPLRLYMSHNVPVALATDDPGVSRDDMTNQYARAVQDQNLSYEQLKQLARNSIEYSFVEGESLWKQHDYDEAADACRRDQSPQCSSFLAQNTKARLEHDLEQKFRAFEAKYGDGLP